MIGYYLRRMQLLVGIAIAITVFSFACKWLHLPDHVGQSGLMMTSDGFILKIMGVALASIIAAVLSSMACGRLRYDAGLLCAASGLVYISWKSGIADYALFKEPNKQVYLNMAIETVILYAILLLVWAILRAGRIAGFLSDNSDLKNETDKEPFDQKLLATVVHAATMGVLVWILCRSDDKLQALASVCVAGYLAALCAHQFVPTKPSPWFWMGSGILATTVYLVCYFTASPTLIGIGQTSGYFGAMARALPIDYASAGTIGTLLGYWTSQQMHHSQDETTETTTTATI